MTVTSINYVIMVIALLCYTLIVVTGLVVAMRARKKQHRLYNSVLRKVINELADIITKEDNKMSKLEKGSYKNTRSSEFPREENTLSHPALNLTSLLTRKPTDEEYEEVIDLLVQLAQETFSEYKFLIARSSDETKDANFLQLVSHYSEAPELHRDIFRKSIEYGIRIPELQKRFALRVQKGSVVPLGDEAVVVLDDGTGNPPTGCSPVNSGLEGGEIAFIISFIQKENVEAFVANNLKKDEGNE